MSDLDLVEVAPNADPPVARLLDYGKLRYLSSKKERETRKSQKSNELKEVRFRPNIGVHDFDAKLRKVRQFIGNGDKVKLTVRFRGREAVHNDLGLSLLKRVAEELKDDIPAGAAAVNGRPGHVHGAHPEPRDNRPQRAQRSSRYGITEYAQTQKLTRAPKRASTLPARASSCAASA